MIKYCQSPNIKIALRVKDSNGLISDVFTTDASFEVPVPVNTYVVNDVNATSKVLKINAENSVADTHKWIFTIFVDGVQKDLVTLNYAVGTEALTYTNFLSATQYLSVLGTYEKPEIYLSGLGDYVVKIEHCAEKNGIKLCEQPKDVNIFITNIINNCASVVHPDIEELAKDFNVRIENGRAIFTWINCQNPPECTAPTNLDAAAIGTTTAMLAWQDSSSIADSYKVSYRLKGTNLWAVSTTQEEFFNLSGLNSFADYEFRVQTVCGDRFSEWSEIAEFKTLEQNVNPVVGSTAFRLGTNIVLDNVRERMKGLKVIRLYLNFGDITPGTVGPPAFDPMYGFGGAISLDALIEFLTLEGILTILCIQGAAKFIPRPSGVENDRFVPLNNTTDDPHDPASFSQEAELMFQIAARYGNGNIDINDARIQVQPGTTKKVNLGYNIIIQPKNEVYEHWEHTNNWNYTDPYGNSGVRASGDWPPEVLLTYLRACYLRIKEADTSMLVGTPGDVKFDKANFKKMNDFRVLKGWPWPFDIYCTHIYYNDTSAWFSNGNETTPQAYKQAVDFGPGGAIHPEKVVAGAPFKYLYEMVADQISYMQSLDCDKEVWVTEIGADGHDNAGGGSSPNLAPTTGLKTNREVMADFIIAYFAHCSAGGANTIAHYMMDHVYGGGEGWLFASSGLCDGNNENTPEHAWYWTQCMSRVLGDLNFSQIVEQVDDGVWVFKWEGDNKSVYMLRHGTVADLSANYTLQLQTNEFSPRLIVPTFGEADGTQSTLTASTSNQVSILVEETSKFIVVDKI